MGFKDLPGGKNDKNLKSSLEASKELSPSEKSRSEKKQ